MMQAALKAPLESAVHYGQQDPAFCAANLSSWSTEWIERVQTCISLPQLALRLRELEAGLVCEGPVRTGIRLQVSVDENGKVEWADGIVTAVWPDSAFRVSITHGEDEDEWAEDFADPTSRDGKKQKDSEWRFPPRPTTTRLAPTARASRAASRVAANISHSERSRAQRGGGRASRVKDEDDGSDEEWGSSDESASTEEQEAQQVKMHNAIQVRHGARKRKWIDAHVTRVFRSGDFEATLDEQADAGTVPTKMKMTSASWGVEWRWRD